MFTLLGDLKQTPRIHAERPALRTLTTGASARFRCNASANGTTTVGAEPAPKQRSRRRQPSGFR
jgi:hypothetical protein